MATPGASPGTPCWRVPRRGSRPLQQSCVEPDQSQNVPPYADLAPAPVQLSRSVSPASELDFARCALCVYSGPPPHCNPMEWRALRPPPLPRLYPCCEHYMVVHAARVNTRRVGSPQRKPIGSRILTPQPDQLPRILYRPKANRNGFQVADPLSQHSRRTVLSLKGMLGS